MDLELRGKSVLITGASKGIGLACAHGFAAEGANVHLAARNTAALEGNPREDVGEAAVQAHRRSLRSIGPRLLSCVRARFVHQWGGLYDRRRRLDATARMIRTLY
jgi:NAD(P)-dependent dehydrogenase (short-subunit alcohol dehydrogenase family)